MNEWQKTLKSQQNRLSLPIKNQNQTTKPSTYMTKANKTVLIIFAHAYIRIDQTPPPPCHKVSHWTDSIPSLKRDVINE